MKKTLALILALTSIQALAQESPGKGCRVLIGEDWVVMGATTIGGCLKYAEAAATPGERQFAQFDTVNLAYKDGQSFQSTDGGKTWLTIRPDSGGSIGALNTLRSGPAGESEKSDSKSKAPVPPPAPPAAAAPTAPAAAAVNATSAAPVMPDLDAPVPLNDTALAAPAGSQSAPLAPPAPAKPYRPQSQAVAAPPAEANQAKQIANDASTKPEQGLLVGCQVRVGEKWQVVPVKSLEECGRVLMNIAAKAQAKTSQAYWSGNYLFFTNQQLYRSSDGQDWQIVK